MRGSPDSEDETPIGSRIGLRYLKQSDEVNTLGSYLIENIYRSDAEQEIVCM
jgi:hypothetical protein